jgi:ATP/maltotriose-dependent transcriptional regulator MalT
MAAWLAHLRAEAHVQMGEWDAAAMLLDRADAILAETPDQPFLPEALGMVRGELALGRGLFATAVETLNLLVPEVDERAGRSFKRLVRVGLARALLTEGEPARAHASLAPLIDRWEPDDEGPFMLSALLPMAAAEVASVLGDAEGAARWSAELAALGSGARADYAQALAGLVGGAAEDGAVIEAAARTVEADGRRWEGAWMLATGAEAARRGGDAGRAGDLAAAALQRFREMETDGWCGHCERLLRRLGRRVPGRRGARGPGGLTARELEVLGLVVDGLSDRAIAERLVIAEGTAGRHVSNVFMKLGAHSRLEAARIAAERGLLGSVERA